MVCTNTRSIKSSEPLWCFHLPRPPQPSLILQSSSEWKTSQLLLKINSRAVLEAGMAPQPHTQRTVAVICILRACLPSDSGLDLGKQPILQPYLENNEWQLCHNLHEAMTIAGASGNSGGSRQVNLDKFWRILGNLESCVRAQGCVRARRIYKALISHPGTCRGSAEATRKHQDQIVNCLLQHWELVPMCLRRPSGKADVLTVQDIERSISWLISWSPNKVPKASVDVE